MKRSLLFALMLAIGCQKSSPPPVAQVAPTEPRVAKTDTSAKLPSRSKRAPKAERSDLSMIPAPPAPTPPPKPKVTLAKEDASAAVHLFLTTQGATTGAVTGGSEDARRERLADVGGGYNDVRVTSVGEPREYKQGSNPKNPAWVVAVSFMANNPRLKCTVRATNHLFLVERFQENQRPKVIFHGSSEEIAKARLGEEWYILNRPPRPETQTTP